MRYLLGLTGLVISSAALAAPPPAPAGITGVYDLAEYAGRLHGLPPHLMRALVAEESSGNIYARSNRGAMGLTQLMPGTAADMGVTNPWDPWQNVWGGAKYLRQQLNLFGRYDLALAAYNAGAGNVLKHKAVPPFAETQAYVNKVAATYSLYSGLPLFPAQGRPVQASRLPQVQPSFTPPPPMPLYVPAPLTFNAASPAPLRAAPAVVKLPPVKTPAPKPPASKTAPAKPVVVKATPAQPSAVKPAPNPAASAPATPARPATPPTAATPAAPAARVPFGWVTNTLATPASVSGGLTLITTPLSGSQGGRP